MICRVYKYPLDIDGPMVVELPGGSQILHVDLQNGTSKLYLWALVPIGSKESLGERKHWFFVAGTGHDIEYPIGSYKHVNTFQSGSHVWHVFEVDEVVPYAAVGYTAGMGRT